MSFENLGSTLFLLISKCPHKLSTKRDLTEHFVRLINVLHRGSFGMMQYKQTRSARINASRQRYWVQRSFQISRPVRAENHERNERCFEIIWESNAKILRPFSMTLLTEKDWNCKPNLKKNNHKKYNCPLERAKSKRSSKIPETSHVRIVYSKIFCVCPWLYNALSTKWKSHLPYTIT